MLNVENARQNIATEQHPEQHPHARDRHLQFRRPHPPIFKSCVSLCTLYGLNTYSQTSTNSLGTIRVAIDPGSDRSVNKQGAVYSAITPATTYIQLRPVIPAPRRFPDASSSIILTFDVF